MPKNISFSENSSGKMMEREDLTSLYDSKRSGYHKYALELYKNYYLYNRDRYKDLEKEKDTRRTNIKSPITHMFTNNVYNMLIESGITFNIGVRNSEKREKTTVIDDMQRWAEYLIGNDGSHLTTELENAFFDAAFLGTGIHTPSYLYRETDVTRLDKQGVKQKDIDIDDYPSARYVSPFSYFTLGDTSSFSRRYSCERKLIPSGKVIAHYARYGITIKQDEIIKKGFYHDTIDWEAVKKNMVFYNHAQGNDILNDDTFDVTNKLLECYEITNGHKLDLWINGIYHGSHPTLGPYKKDPYIHTTFKKIPGIDYGLGIGFLMKPLQESFDTILNYRIDNVKVTMNKMFLADNSVNMFGNNSRIKMKPGAVIKVPNVDSIKEMQVSEVKQSAYAETGEMFSMAQGMTGISAPTLGLQNKVERVSGGPELYKASADAQLNQLLKNIEKSMAETMKFMMIYTLVYTDQSSIDKVLGKNNDLSNLNVREVMDDFEFDFNLSNEKLDTQAVKRNQLMSLLQTGLQVGPGGQPLLPQELTSNLVSSIIKTYNLDIDSSLLDPKKIQQAMQDEQGLIDSVQLAQSGTQKRVAPQGATPASGGQQSPPTKTPEQMMRDLQQQGAGGIPKDMTTNPQGKNQFTS